MTKYQQITANAPQSVQEQLETGRISFNEVMKENDRLREALALALSRPHGQTGET